MTAMQLPREELADAAGGKATLASQELAARPVQRRVSSVLRTCVLVAVLLSFMRTTWRTAKSGLASLRLGEVDRSHGREHSPHVEAKDDPSTQVDALPKAAKDHKQ